MIRNSKDRWYPLEEVATAREENFVLLSKCFAWLKNALASLSTIIEWTHLCHLWLHKTVKTGISQALLSNISFLTHRLPQTALICNHSQFGGLRASVSLFTALCYTMFACWFTHQLRLCPNTNTHVIQSPKQEPSRDSEVRPKMALGLETTPDELEDLISGHLLPASFDQGTWISDMLAMRAISKYWEPWWLWIIPRYAIAVFQRVVDQHSSFESGRSSWNKGSSM